VPLCDADTDTKLIYFLMLYDQWKFAFISMNRPDYLQDSDVVSARFQRRDVYGAWEQYLGLEHADTAPKRAYTANQVCCCLVVNL
jgi:hypothetical protein